MVVLSSGECEVGFGKRKFFRRTASFDAREHRLVYGAAQIPAAFSLSEGCQAANDADAVSAERQRREEQLQQLEPCPDIRQRYFDAFS